MALEIGRPEERVAMRVSWFVERIAKGASSPHWCTERMNMWEVLQDPAAAKDAGDHLRFIAPSSATDEDLDALLQRGAMPTGGGRIYQQTFIDTYAKVAFAKLYDRKTPITAATLVNDRIGPFYDAHQVKLCRVLTDRGTEYCGNPEHHEYELYRRSRTSIVPAPRPRGRRPTELWSDSTRPCSTSSIAWPSVKKSMAPSADCSTISTGGSEAPMRRGRTKVDGALARLQCRPFLTQSRLQGRR
jgi:hypothetical protein